MSEPRQRDDVHEESVDAEENGIRPSDPMTVALWTLTTILLGALLAALFLVYSRGL